MKCVLQPSAMQTARHVRGLPTDVRAAGTQRPSSILAAVCLSVQLDTTPKDECVQVGQSFKYIHQNRFSKLSLILQ